MIKPINSSSAAYNSIYCDDYHTPDARSSLTPFEKNFNKILFKPGRPLQTRELNQVQSILQNQVSQVGAYAIQNNTRMMGANATLNRDLIAFRLTPSTTEVSDVTEAIDNILDIYEKSVIAHRVDDTSQFAEFTITQNRPDSILDDEQIIVRVTHLEKMEQGGTYQLVVYGQYVATGLDDQKLNSSEECTLNITGADAADALSLVSTQQLSCGLTEAVDTISASIDNGFYFIDGVVVAITAQETYINPFVTGTIVDSSYTGHLILEVNERIITPVEDPTLLDNAGQALNFKSPGADRISRTATLQFINTLNRESTTVVVPDKFILIFDIKDSAIARAKQIETENDKETDMLTDLMARRTYEINGDFALKPFGGTIEEVVTYNKINGYYPIDQLYKSELWDLYSSSNNGGSGVSLLSDGYVASNSADKINEYAVPMASYIFKHNAHITVSPGTAYIKGYRVNVPEALQLYLRKGTDTIDKQGVAVSAMTGSYVYATMKVESDDSNDNDTIVSPMIFDSDNYIVEFTDSVGEIATATVNSMSPSRIRREDTDYESSEKYVGFRMGISGFTLADTDKTTYDIKFFTITDKNTGTPIASGKISTVRGAVLHTSINGEYARLIKIPDYPIKGIINVVIPIRYNITGLNNVPIEKVPDDTNAAGLSWVKFDKEDNVSYKLLDFTVIISDGTTDKLYGNDEIVNIETDLAGDDVDKVRITFKNDHEGKHAKITTYKKVTPVRGTKTYTKETILIETGLSSAQDLVGGYPAGTEITLPGVRHLIDSDSPYYEVVSDGQTASSYNDAVIRLKTDGFKEADGAVSSGIFSIHGGTSSNTLRIGLKNVEHWKLSTTDGAPQIFTASSYERGGYVGDPLFLGDSLDEYIDIRYIPEAKTLPLAHQGSVSFDETLYVPRIDVVALNTSGHVRVVEGTAAIEPNIPTLKDDEMAILTLRVPAGCTYADEIENIVAKQATNKTSCDVSDILNRLKRLEEYVLTDSLEKTTSTTIITDGDGIRFKSGFITDTFTKFSIGDTSSPSYRCSIDTSAGVLRPMFNTRLIEFGLPDIKTLNDSGLDLYGEDMIAATVAGGEVYTSNLYATQHISVQPHDVTLYQGKCLMFPRNDTWSDTKTNPAIDIDLDKEEREALLAANEDTSNIHWGGWYHGLSTHLTKAEQAQNRRNFYNRQWNGKHNQSFLVDFWRTGTKTVNVAKMETQHLGNVMTSAALKPYMRSRIMKFTCVSLKPNTKHYLFLDGVDVTRYAFAPTTPMRSVWVHANWDNWSSANGAIKFADDNRDHPHWPMAQPIADEEYLMSWFISKTNIALTNPFVTRGELITTSAGRMAFWFVVPNSDELRFNVGEKKFDLVDSPRNIKDEITSQLSTTYFAQGLEVGQSSLDITTTEMSTEKIRVRQERNNVTRWTDPVAQTIFISPETVADGDDGVFMDSVELFFASKPTGAIKRPVSIYFTEVIAGQPSGVIVPRSEVTLEADQVDISDDSKDPTNFKFEKPILLKANTEYALVVSSTSPEYRIFIAERGFEKYDLLQPETRVTHQASDGTLLTSSNRRTWLAHPDKDMKFILNKTIFDADTQRSHKMTLIPKISNSIKEVNIDKTGSGIPSDITLKAIVNYAIKKEAVLEPVVVDGKLIEVKVVDGGDGYITNDSVKLVLYGPNGTEEPDSYWLGVDYPTVTFSLSNGAIAALKFNGPVSIPSQNNNIEYYLNITQDGINAKTIKLYPATAIEKFPIDNFKLLNYNSDTLTLDVNFSVTSTSTPYVALEDISIETRSFVLDQYREDKTSSYITKTIIIDNPASQLDVILDINRPSETANIKVFAEVAPVTEDTDTVQEPISYEMELISSDEIPINPNDTNKYAEVKFVHTPVGDDTVEEFSRFRIKIVFYGSKVTDACAIRNFRAIATA